MTKEVILVSPGCVDGYPPVQYQARLLANRGYIVHLITSPPSRVTPNPEFRCGGVTVYSVSPDQMYSRNAILRTLAFARILFDVRRKLKGKCIEVAFDPLGMFYSDITPLQPKIRIAHFHELIQHDIFIERRLRKNIRAYSIVVVPDENRGSHTQKALALWDPPLVVPNFPLRAVAPIKGQSSQKTALFEVVYCGQLGRSQRLDAVIHSIPLWPENSQLVLIGDDKKPYAEVLKKLANELGVTDRIQFLGWLPTNEEVENRLSLSDLGLSMLDSSNEQWRTALHASNKRFQYMKAALPQIGDVNPGVPELLEGKRIGACVRDNTPEEIARLVHAYAGDPERCTAEGARAFSLHQATYNYEAAFQPLLDRIENW